MGLFGLTAFWNLKQKLTFIIMVFNAHSENVLFSGIFFIKSYYELKLFISYVFVKKLKL